MGISDGTYSEITAAEVHEGDQVVIGIEARAEIARARIFLPGLGLGNSAVHDVIAASNRMRK